MEINFLHVQLMNVIKVMFSKVLNIEIVKEIKNGDRMMWHPIVQKKVMCWLNMTKKNDSLFSSLSSYTYWLIKMTDFFGYVSCSLLHAVISLVVYWSVKIKNNVIERDLGVGDSSRLLFNYCSFNWKQLSDH